MDGFWSFANENPAVAVICFVALLIIVSLFLSHLVSEVKIMVRGYPPSRDYKDDK